MSQGNPPGAGGPPGYGGPPGQGPGQPQGRAGGTMPLQAFDPGGQQAPQPNAPVPNAPVPNAPVPDATMPGATQPFAPMPGAYAPPGQAPQPFAPMPGAYVPPGQAPQPFAPMPGAYAPPGQAPQPFAPMPGAYAPPGQAPQPYAPMPAGQPQKKSSKLILGCGSVMLVVGIIAVVGSIQWARRRSAEVDTQLEALKAAAANAQPQVVATLSGSCKKAYDCCLAVTSNAGDAVLGAQCETFKFKGHTEPECTTALEGYAKVAKSRGLTCE